MSKKHLNQKNNAFKGNQTTTLTGTVTQKSSAGYLISSGGREYACALSTRYKKQNDESITVGDQVEFSLDGPQNGMILGLLARRNKFSRRGAAPMPSSMPFEQVIAANVDQVIPVFAAAQPAPHWNLLDRYLVSAEVEEIPSVICLTKIDLARGADGRMDSEVAEAVETYRKIGYPVIVVSSRTGEGLDEIKAALSGKFSVLVGKSGVGKTSLLNAIEPGLGLRVSAVSQLTGKGRHTTTHLEQFPLHAGGSVVDTPGVREFGLWDVGEDILADCFPEMRPYLGRCKFGTGCHHNEEPGCAVRKAVMSGAIHPRRYHSYMHLKEDL